MGGRRFWIWIRDADETRLEDATRPRPKPRPVVQLVWFAVAGSDGVQRRSISTRPFETPKRKPPGERTKPGLRS